MITKATAVAPAPGRPERWLTFLHEVFDGDADLIAFMQRAAGYAHTIERANTNCFSSSAQAGTANRYSWTC
jgi:phage/plasmid-associated DNA primase